MIVAGAPKPPAHLADMVMSGKSVSCPGPTAPLAGAWVAAGGWKSPGQVGRAGGGLGNVEAEVCLGGKIWEVNKAYEGCKALSKMPCLGKGWRTERCGTEGMAEPVWALPLQTCSAGSW